MISSSSKLSSEGMADSRRAAGIDKVVIDTILKEAVAGDLNDAKMIASTIANRARLTGKTWKSIIEAPGQYTAYDRKGYPPGVNAPQYRAIIEQAVDEVLRDGPITNATFYATPAAVGRLPGGLEEVGTSAGHVFKSDPKNRPIKTKQGYVHLTEDRLRDFQQKVADTVNTVREAVGLPSTGQRGKPSVRRNVEVLAMGTNDFSQPDVAAQALEQAVSGALAQGRTPVAVMPNANNPKIAPAAEAVAETAARLGVETVTPSSWAQDGIHPSQKAYKEIAEKYDGAVVRGDSFAEGIIAAQAHKNDLSYAKKGASAAAIVSATAEMDAASAPRGRGLQDVADVTDVPAGTGAWSEAPGSEMEKVDGRVKDILGRAAEQFAREMPGYSVQAFSGAKGRRTGTMNHPTGRAVDVNIFDAAGNKLGNVRNGATFPTYERYAQIARDIQQRDYPELDNSFRWGGYFQQGTSFDQMHFDISGGATAYGSWDTGLNEAGKKAFAKLGYPDVQSVGMPQRMANVPVPTPRPDPELGLAQLQANESVQPSLSESESVQPSQERPDSIVGSLASLLSPVSSAEAAPFSQADAAPSPAPDSMGPIGAGETIVGEDITDAFMSQPSAVSPIAARPAPTMDPNEALAGLTPAGSNSTLYHNPVHRAVQPLTPESIQPLSPDVVSPLTAEESIVGQEVTLPDPNEVLTGVPARVAKMAPPLAPPKTVKNYPVAVPQPPQAAPSVPTPAPRPSFTPADIYGGQVGMATASDGNIVSRDPYGRTAVTNKYGATTVSLPDGRQAASRQKGPFTKSMREKNPLKSVLGDLDIDERSLGAALLGALAGGALGGPAGAAVGGALGRRLTSREDKPRAGILDSLFGPDFPDAPKIDKGIRNKSSGPGRDLSDDARSYVDTHEGLF